MEKLLFAQLREDKGAETFFYFAEDTTEPVRIIEQVLKRKPVWIPKRFCSVLLNCEVIRTPEQERKRKFKNLDVSGRYREHCSTQSIHTYHVVEAFLDYDAPTMQHYHNHYQFKKAPSETDIEAVPDDEGLLIHELTLSTVYIHEKPQFKMCSRHLAAVEPRCSLTSCIPPSHSSSTESSDANLHQYSSNSATDVHHECKPSSILQEATENCRFWPEERSVCDCSALHVLNLMTQELQHVTAFGKSELNMGRQLALKSMPRDLSFDIWDEDLQKRVEPVLSWTIDDSLTGFKIIIREEGKGEPLHVNIITEEIQAEIITEEVQAEEVIAEEVQAKEVITEDAQAKEVITEDAQAKEVITEEIQTKEVTTEEVQAKEVITEQPIETSIDNSPPPDQNDIEMEENEASLDTPSTPDILLLSTDTRIILRDGLLRGHMYNAQVCWDKEGTLYSPPLSFVVPPIPQCHWKHVTRTACCVLNGSMDPSREQISGYLSSRVRNRSYWSKKL
ncbi:hypothetical protein BDP27DRAFT_429216 [Rhodocollybia butyracea]|uniref:Uncharacterized protein n=1 Tax=Rhodocollybia butyracea TaxID=206335 RepID=A0A9P5TYA6_9AGAR|nr:hypothetical protein BDP27DRAFT_429216 [Rhodocollybia butyracea]